ncbi:DUF2062 domain-containing protein [Phragmitibacter flavus]|uniref:DUF2062 domain-containing protein n=1 Tax=Phragmitibacter flavus TaxID=2576071 RepID=A0A5R8KGK4_9BACT|nr:DUF2062 domain-containing protein [Phragmitibacter flavus]TLD71436.1 DUF2062 domain-containing protein [Phragmitibacter flavus]
MQRRYRKFVLQLYRRLRHPRMLKQSRVMRWFARHFLVKSVWKPTRHTFAGGTAVGLFVGALLIPGQMPLAALICGIFRVNIPIAIVICWMSNPVTFAPIAWWEINLGNWLMEVFHFGEVVPLRWSELTAMARGADDLWSFFGDVKPWAGSLYLGGVVAGLLLMPVGYLVVFALWDVVLMLAHRRKLRKKAVADALVESKAKNEENDKKVS